MSTSMDSVNSDLDLVELEGSFFPMPLPTPSKVRRVDITSSDQLPKFLVDFTEDAAVLNYQDASLCPPSLMDMEIYSSTSAGENRVNAEVNTNEVPVAAVQHDISEYSDIGNCISDVGTDSEIQVGTSAMVHANPENDSTPSFLIIRIPSLKMGSSIAKSNDESKTEESLLQEYMKCAASRTKLEKFIRREIQDYLRANQEDIKNAEASNLLINKFGQADCSTMMIKLLSSEANANVHSGAGDNVNSGVNSGAGDNVNSGVNSGAGDNINSGVNSAAGNNVYSGASYNIHSGASYNIHSGSGVNAHSGAGDNVNSGAGGAGNNVHSGAGGAWNNVHSGAGGAGNNVHSGAGNNVHSGAGGAGNNVHTGAGGAGNNLHSGAGNNVHSGAGGAGNNVHSESGGAGNNVHFGARDNAQSRAVDNAASIAVLNPVVSVNIETDWRAKITKQLFTKLNAVMNMECSRDDKIVRIGKILFTTLFTEQEIVKRFVRKRKGALKYDEIKVFEIHRIINFMLTQETISASDAAGVDDGEFFLEKYRSQINRPGLDKNDQKTFKQAVLSKYACDIRNGRCKYP